MKPKIALHSLVCLFLVVFASLGYAGDYHQGLTLKCQDCHVMHYSQQHGYNANGTGNYTQMLGGPHEFLLRDDVNDLCMACHDGSASAPDVVGLNTSSYVRQAGALNQESGGGLYPTSTGHTLGSQDPAPGSTPEWSDSTGLSCVDCHRPHGSSSSNSYRNLRTLVTWTSGGSNPLTAAVHEDANSGVNANHYGVAGITFNEPGGTGSAYATFCKSCHTDYHGLVGGAQIGGAGSPPQDFIRHPATDVNIGQAGGGHSKLTQITGKANQVQVMSPLGQKAGHYDGTDPGLTPSCMSCHKGHGNQNAFGLIYMAGSGFVTEEGDSSGTQLRDLCRQCHSQGAP